MRPTPAATAALILALTGCVTTPTEGTTSPEPGQTAGSVTIPPLASGQPGFAGAAGTAERVCVDVDRLMAGSEPKMVGPQQDIPVFDIRSGDFLAGNFASVVGQWSANWPEGAAKIYWIPFDPGTAMTGALRVVVERVEGTGPVSVQEFEITASNLAGRFWPTGTKFPGPGRYRLTATAPGHWGCFELSV